MVGIVAYVVGWFLFYVASKAFSKESPDVPVKHWPKWFRDFGILVIVGGWIACIAIALFVPIGLLGGIILALLHVYLARLALKVKIEAMGYRSGKEFYAEMHAAYFGEDKPKNDDAAYTTISKEEDEEGIVPHRKK